MKIRKVLKDCYCVLNGDPRVWRIQEGKVTYPSFLEYFSETSHGFDLLDYYNSPDHNSMFAFSVLQHAGTLYQFIMSWIPKHNHYSKGGKS